MKCPACKNRSGENPVCPQCGWEFRIYLNGPGEAEKREYEAELEKAQKKWQTRNAPKKEDAPKDEKPARIETAGQKNRAEPETIPKPGETRTDPKTGMQFVWAPAGSFQRRQWSDKKKRSEGPVCQVELRGFWIGKYPVTQCQWEPVMKINPSRFKGADLPVENVTWDEACKFAEFLNKKRTGAEKFRLPTEAEWEYACRAGCSGVFCFGDNSRDLGAFAWYAKNSKGRPHPTGQKKPNAWGLFDMHGNVWEWCHDYFGRYLPGCNPVGRIGTCRVYRGGSWKQEARICGCSFRNWIEQTKSIKNDSLGFRLVMSADPIGMPK